MMQYFITKWTEGLQAGGKGNNLFLLKERGYNVPEFIVIPAEYVEKLKEEDYSDLIENILQYFEKITGKDRHTLRLAVRSSANAEDNNSASFAGMFESVLGVNASGIGAAFNKVRASSGNSRVIQYASRMGIDGSGLAMAIIIQLMVNAEISGVGFGVNPVNQSPDQKLIAALYGLGEGLVSGQLDADNYLLFSDGTIQSEVANKQEQLLAFENEIKKINIPLTEANKAVLSPDQVHYIGKVLDQLAIKFKIPQDIEFAYAGGEFYLLQSRSVTTIANQSKGDRMIWDNSNILESYPGLTRPLTFSFILKMYESVYAQLMQVMGVSKAEVEDQRLILSNMLAMYHGRVYYNLLNWYRALAVVPGFAINAPFMEKMMGVREKIEISDIPVRSKAKEWFRVMRMFIQMSGNLISLPAQRRKFDKEFKAIRTHYEQINYAEKSAQELIELYKAYEVTLLKKWKAPLVNDFFVMIYFGLMQKMLTKYGLDGHLHNDLLIGSRDILSTEPVRRTLEITDLIRNDASTFSFFRDNNADAIKIKFLAGQLPDILQEKITNFLADWGHRISGELKLETETYPQRPELYFKLLQSYLRQDIKSTGNQPDMKFRQDAEAAVNNQLKNHPIKRAILRWLISKTRTLVSARENLRYARTLAYGIVRNIFTALGQKLATGGALDDPRDIFYLSQQDVFSFINGTFLDDSLMSLVSLRKKNYTAWALESPPPERFETYGLCYVGQNISKPNSTVSSENQDFILEGIGCCPGIVRAKARILFDPMQADDLQGDILVTIHTDPGWVVLFPTAGAIIVEKGSLLSHSAIVSREMGIPCIVGVKNATTRITDGAMIEIDGRTGKIKLIPS